METLPDGFTFFIGRLPSKLGCQSLKNLLRMSWGTCAWDIDSSLMILYVLAGGVQKTTAKLLESWRDIRCKRGTNFWLRTTKSSNMSLEVSSFLKQLIIVRSQQVFLCLNLITHELGNNSTFFAVSLLEKKWIENILRDWIVPLCLTAVFVWSGLFPLPYQNFCCSFKRSE